jgi:hypothetical protein
VYLPKLAEVQNHPLISVNNDDVSESEEYNFTWGSVADYYTNIYFRVNSHQLSIATEKEIPKLNG